VGRPSDDLQYRIVEDKKSFWGARHVVVELITDGKMKFAPPAASGRPQSERGPALEEVPIDDETIAEVSRILRELLVAAELSIEVKHQADLAFDLVGDDLPHLLARQGEGLEGLQTLAGRIAGKKVGHPVFPQLDAEGFRERRQEVRQESARRQAGASSNRGAGAARPMSSDRRLVHLSLENAGRDQERGEGFSSGSPSCPVGSAGNQALAAARLALRALDRLLPLRSRTSSSKGRARAMRPHGSILSRRLSAI
jgi:predicted RNA-binding protein Jag